jgi:predicted enzyme related to lactoylglutathione lyase
LYDTGSRPTFEGAFMTIPSPAPDTGGGLLRAGKLSYIQIPADDPLLSGAFYEAVFGWTLRGDAEHLGFTDASGELIGAFMTGRAVSAQPGILPYVSVSGVDAAIERIEAHGGEVVLPPYPEGDLWVATFRDPAGNVMGIWQMGGR